jgi:hypothetical protein
MKKVFTIVSCLCLSFASLKSQAQIFSENFDAGTTLPAGWVQYDVDGQVVATNVATIMGTNAWAVRAGGPSGTGNQVTSTSWYTPAGVANDWLVSPSITIPAGPAVLKFDIQAQDPNYPDGYKVYVSTTGNTVADFGTTPVFSEAAAPTTYTTKYVDLATFSGSTVYIAFQNNSNDMFLLNLDNVSIVSPLAVDMSAIALNLPSFAGNGSSIPVTGTMFNYGSAAVTSMTINYQVDANTPVTQNLTGLNIAAISGTYNYSFTTPWIAGPVGNHTIKVWATNINGGTDLNTANDQITGTVMVASQLVTRVACVEEFTSSTCAPCASLNATFDPLLAANFTNDVTPSFANLTAVKYQMDWPAPGNDPSFNADGDTRRGYYNVGGIPDGYIDGKAMQTYDQTELNTSRFGNPAVMSLSATSAISGNSITVNVSLTPHISVPSGTKMFISVMEKEYDYAASTTTQDVFHHITRKMLPDGNGIALTNLVDGTVVNKTESYTFTIPGTVPAQNSYDLWTSMSNLEVVAFVQNVATKEIYQAALANKAPSGLNNLSNGFVAHVYPNPVADVLVLNISSDVSNSGNIEIVNALGQLVVTERIEAVNAGETNFRIKTDNIESGIYFARVTFGDKLQTIKFTVSK